MLAKRLRQRRFKDWRLVACKLAALPQIQNHTTDLVLVTSYTGNVPHRLRTSLLRRPRSVSQQLQLHPQPCHQSPAHRPLVIIEPRLWTMLTRHGEVS